MNDIKQPSSLADKLAGFDPDALEYAIHDALADLATLDLVFEAAIPDDDASASLGLPFNPGLYRVVMTRDLHRALMRAVKHVRDSVGVIQAGFEGGGYAAMRLGLDGFGKGGAA